MGDRNSSMQQGSGKEFAFTPLHWARFTEFLADASLFGGGLKGSIVTVAQVSTALQSDEAECGSLFPGHPLAREAMVDQRRFLCGTSNDGSNQPEVGVATLRTTCHLRFDGGDNDTKMTNQLLRGLYGQSPTTDATGLVKRLHAAWGIAGNVSATKHGALYQLPGGMYLQAIESVALPFAADQVSLWQTLYEKDWRVLHPTDRFGEHATIATSISDGVRAHVRLLYVSWGRESGRVGKDVQRCLARWTELGIKLRAVDTPDIVAHITNQPSKTTAGKWHRVHVSAGWQFLPCLSEFIGQSWRTFDEVVWPFVSRHGNIINIDPAAAMPEWPPHTEMFLPRTYADFAAGSPRSGPANILLFGHSGSGFSFMMKYFLCDRIARGISVKALVMDAELRPTQGLLDMQVTEVGYSRNMATINPFTWATMEDLPDIAAALLQVALAEIGEEGGAVWYETAFPEMLQAVTLAWGYKGTAAGLDEVIDAAQVLLENGTAAALGPALALLKPFHSSGQHGGILNGAAIDPAHPRLVWRSDGNKLQDQLLAVVLLLFLQDLRQRREACCILLANWWWLATRQENQGYGLAQVLANLYATCNRYGGTVVISSMMDIDAARLPAVGRVIAANTGIRMRLDCNEVPKEVESGLLDLSVFDYALATKINHWRPYCSEFFIQTPFGNGVGHLVAGPYLRELCSSDWGDCTENTTTVTALKKRLEIGSPENLP